MTVFYDPKSKGYRYDFWHLKRRHRSPRGFETKSEARDAEAELRRRLRRQAAGLEVGGTADSPAIHDWAEVYMDHLERRGRSTDAPGFVLRVVLRFFGRRPARPLKPHEAGPYLDLRLVDPVSRPAHLLDFENWMIARRIAPATRNRYRTAMSQLYALAMRPQYRQVTGVTMNPFRGLERDVERGRTVTLSDDQLRAILAQAPRHLWLTITIAALAPMLRVGNILALRWDQHVSADLRLITVPGHKTASSTGLPLVTPVSDRLREVLAAVKAERDAEAAAVRRTERSQFVVRYRGRPLRSIDTGLKAACQAAGVPYGQRVGGVTFHTIRHTAATRLAALGIAEGVRKEAMGHASIATTQRYTHLAAAHIVPAVEQLAAALPVGGLVGGLPPKRVRRTPPEPPESPTAPGRRRRKP